MSACAGDDPADPNDPSDPNDPNDPNDPVEPDNLERDYDEVAAAVGASVRGGELAAMIDAVVIAEGGAIDGFTVLAPGELTGERAGVTFTYSYHCNDDADVILAFCDGNANHAHIHVAMEGSFAMANMAVESIVREGNWTIRDMRVDKPRVGGDGEMAFTTTVTGDVRSTYTLSYDANFDRVRFLTGQTQPHEGKIDLSIAAQRTRGDDSRTFGVIGVIQFAAGGAATITLDADREYSLDLATGVTVRL